MSTINGRIALINTQGQLCTCDADGGNFRTLTRPDRSYQFPAWSPDGQAIAAIGSDRRGTGVYYFEDKEQGQQWQLYRSWLGSRKSPFYLYWAPDSRTISFIANSPLHGIGLFLVSAESNATAEMVTHGQPFYWQWRADSAEILVHSGSNASKRFSFIKPYRGGDNRRNHAFPGGFQSPGISYNGQYLAYSTTPKANSSAIAIEAVGSKERVYISHQGSTVFSWSPTRNELAFMAPQQAVRHYYGPLKLAQLSGKTIQLTPYPVLAFFWSPDGRKIAYFTPVQNDKLFQVTGSDKIAYHNGHNPPRMVRDQQQVKHIDLSLWVIDLDQQTRRQITEFRSTQLFIKQFAPFFDQYAHSHRIWSPDSEALVVPIAKGASQREITVVPISGAEPIVLSRGIVGFWRQQ